LSVAIDNSDLTESDRKEKREFIRKEIYLNSTASFFVEKRERKRAGETDKAGATFDNSFFDNSFVFL
jgi:hypothetical protein